MFDRLVRMQHFNLPTRLLDVTLNPLVALWFATEDCKIDDEPADGKVQAFFVPDNRSKFYDSDRVSCMANLANVDGEQKREMFSALENGSDDDDFRALKSVQALVSYVKMEKPYFENKIRQDDFHRPVYVKPKMSNRRILAQSGAFLLYGKRVKSTTVSNMGIKRVLIAHEKKRGIRDELNFFGINAGTLLPEIDKAAAIITARYNGIETDDLV